MGERSLTEPRKAGEPAWVVAHRGAWKPAPQNSLAAFERAIVDGADAVELDVRRTRDGRLVVVHDPRIGMRAVARLGLEELRVRMQPGQAPELDEVLAALAGRIAVDVELKEDGYVEAAMEVVTRHLSPDRYVVTSFLDDVLPQVTAAVPEARTGLLVASRRTERRLERRVAATGVSFLAPHLGLARDSLLDWAAERGLPAWVWTVNEPRAMRGLLADPRVGAVITDHAGQAAAEAGDRHDGPHSTAA